MGFVFPRGNKVAWVPSWKSDLGEQPGARRAAQFTEVFHIDHHRADGAVLALTGAAERRAWELSVRLDTSLVAAHDLPARSLCPSQLASHWKWEKG